VSSGSRLPASRLGEKVIGKRMGHYAMFQQSEELGKIFMEFLKRRKVV